MLAHHHVRPLRWVGMSLVILLIHFLGAEPAVLTHARQAAQPNLWVSPVSGPAGLTVRVSGTGWVPAPNGEPYQLHWDTRNGSLLGTFTPDPKGAFSISVVIPAMAANGVHDIWACQHCSGAAKPVWVTALFEVKNPATPTPPRPTPTPTATVTATQVPTDCDSTGLAGETLIDFEGIPAATRLDGLTLAPGIRFLGDDALVVFRPLVGTRSGTQGLINHFGSREFGSINIPIRIGFDNLADFVGVFVGLNEQIWADEPFTATLTAYGLNMAGRRYVAGSDSATLGPAAEDIRVCLAVEAPGAIFEVTIDYTGTGGVAEGEAIDDLVIRGPVEPVPVPSDNRPPEVEIEHPEDGAQVDETYVRIDGTIQEDREMGRVELWVNGALYRELGFTRTSETTYRFFLDAIPAAELVNCGENQVEVRAWDAAGLQGTDRVAFSLRSGDLRVTGAEPVQVIYDAPLVVGKTTAFRVHVDSTYACDVLAEFRLVLPEDQWETGVPAGWLAETGADPGWRMPETSDPMQIPALARDHVVMLPYIRLWEVADAWDPVRSPNGKVGISRVAPRPSANPVSFSVEVDPNYRYGETDESNNRIESGPYGTVTTRGIRVVFIGQVWDHAVFTANSRFATEEDFLDNLPDYAEEQMEYLLATYPVADTKVSWETLDSMYFRADHREDYLEDPNCWDSDLNKEKGCNACFSSRMSSMIQSDPTTSDAHAVGLVQPYGCCGCNGAGIAVYLEDDGSIDGNLVHELGHQDIGAWDCYSCTAADGTCGCSSRRPCGEMACESCFADEGFWVGHWRQMPASLRYYMWCVADPVNIWTRLLPCSTTAGTETSAGYLRMIERLADDVDPAAVVVRGKLTNRDEAAFAPFLRVDQAILDLEPGSSGTHSIVFLDKAGGVLASHGFTPVFTRYLPETEDPAELDTYYFSFRLGWEDAIARIELRDGRGLTLASRVVSDKAPVVELDTPNGGEVWPAGSTQTIRWTAQDPDGGELSYALWISDDDGAVWQPVAIDLEETEFIIDTAGFPEGDAYRIKVRVTDGVNTGEDASDAVFAIRTVPVSPFRYLVICALAAAAGIGLACVGFLIWRQQRRAKQG